MPGITPVVLLAYKAGASSSATADGFLDWDAWSALLLNWYQDTN
ncbi:MAG: hypothetical protein AAB214_10900 [Fibrobacterota bacterium]